MRAAALLNFTPLYRHISRSLVHVQHVNTQLQRTAEGRLKVVCCE